MKKLLTLLVLAFTCITVSAICQAAPPKAQPQKDGIDASGVDIQLPIDLSGLPPKQKQQVLQEFCATGCTVIPNEIIEQIDQKQHEYGELIQKQQDYIKKLTLLLGKLQDQCAADDKANTSINEQLKSELKSST